MVYYRLLLLGDRRIYVDIGTVLPFIYLLRTPYYGYYMYVQYYLTPTCMHLSYTGIHEKFGNFHFDSVAELDRDGGRTMRA